MPQMNDNHDTEINLTKVKLKEVTYDGGEDLKLKYLLNLSEFIEKVCVGIMSSILSIPVPLKP